MLLADKDILSLDFIHGLKADQVQSYGYDVTLGSQWAVPAHNDPNPATSKYLIDLTSERPRIEFTCFEASTCIVLPGSFVLGVSKEYFKMPDNILGICLGRSSLSRIGLVPNITPLEPGWEGFITIEISNLNPQPIVVYAGLPISQIIFFKGKRPSRNYVEKGGRYNKQDSLTLPKFGRER